MDISETLAPNSDQLDAIELIGNPRTFTITEVSRGNAEQPVQVHLAEFPRPWRPGKSMRRVLAACWGTDASVWIGRRVRLYCDESIRFGSETVGGTRIEALSHIDKARKIPLLITRGKSATFTVHPLAEPVASGPTSQQITDATAHYRDTWSVSVEQLEAHVGRSATEWTAADIAALRTLSGELKRGEKRVQDEFPERGVSVDEIAAPVTQPTKTNSRTKSATVTADEIKNLNTDTDPCPVCAAAPGQAHDDDVHEAAGA